MEIEQIPLSWDEVSFKEICAIIERACEPEIARELTESYLEVERVYENPGTLPRASEPISSGTLKAARGQLNKFSKLQRNCLQERINSLHGAYLLGAISALGSIPRLNFRELITIPGLYDKEIEWLSTFTLSPTGHIPTWSQVLDVLQTARNCLIADMFAPPTDDSPFKRLREKSMQAKDLGVTYVPIARDMTTRLVKLVEKHPAIQNSFLLRFPQDTEMIFDQHLKRLSSIVYSTFKLKEPVSASHDYVLSLIMQSWDVASIVDSLKLEEYLANTSCVTDLTTQILTPTTAPVDIRERPLLAIGRSAILLMPRRIGCDRHEVLDQAVLRFLREKTQSQGIYPDLRASMLDSIVGEAIQQLLPDSKVYIGEVWDVDGEKYERDVVVFYEDIAICVETKAAHMIPSLRSSRRDVIQILRQYMQHGVKQVTSIADALEAGTARLKGVDLPTVRRAYRFVASYNSWWGIDLATSDLFDAGVLPKLDAAMLTSADKFVCYEKLFEHPADFISYLDHRLSHQRRPWVTINDEFELIGTYFTNPTDGWRHRPSQDMQVLTMNSFQDDITQTIRAAYLETQNKRSYWISRKHRPLITSNLAVWEKTKPEGWLQAFSAASRIPARTQRLITQHVDLENKKKSNRRPIDIINLPKRACTLGIVRDPEKVTKRIWDNKLRDVPAGSPLVVIQQSDQRILCIRGIDDTDLWMNSNWARQLNQSVAGSPRMPRRQRFQRAQPKRTTRRSRRS